MLVDAAPAGRTVESKLSKGIPFLQRMSFGIIECMGSGTKTNHRFFGFQVVLYQLHLISRKLAPTQIEYSQVCLFEGFQSWYVFLCIVVGICLQHDGAETIIFFQFCCNNGQGGLTAVFMIASNENDQRFFGFPFLFLAESCC